MPQSVPPNGRTSTRPSAAERRREARAPIELKVEYKRLNSFFADYTRNISRDGTFIATAKPLPIGTEFVFKLTVPTMGEPLALKGTVSWIVKEHEATADRPAGMGIKFRYDDDADRKRVHDAVWDLLVASLGEHVAKRLMESGEADPHG
jgi:type IV pilus assembly protein PilZ